MLAQLHARWAREEKETKIARIGRIANISTICAIEEVKTLSTYESPTGPKYANGKIIGVGESSTSSKKNPRKLESVKTVFERNAENVETLEKDDSTILDDNDIDFDNCNLTEVIKFLQKIAKTSNTSKINMAFTKHITDALIKAREERLQLEVSIPRKLEDNWDPTIKMRVNDFDCNALCDLGASVSIMPKKLYDILDLEPLEACHLGVHLADSTMKRPVGRINDVLIVVNDNYVPVDFLVMDIDCKASCPIILGRHFLRTVGAIIDMKDGVIKFQFPLKRGMKHFPKRRMKQPYESIVRASYASEDGNIEKT